MNNKILVLCISILLVLIIASYATTMTGMFLTQTNNYKINGLFVSGNKLINDDCKIGDSNGCLLDIVISQPITKNHIQTYKGGNYELCLGTLCTYIEPQYDIKLTGTLGYKNENLVEKGSKVIAKIFYNNEIVKQVETTVDKNGKFELELNDIPDSIIDKEFVIKIYVEGKIEALYECTHKVENGEHICN